jgi:hypothetical protein
MVIPLKYSDSRKEGSRLGTESAKSPLQHTFVIDEGVAPGDE